jgi:REP-associated tyrosine transposase
MSHSKFDTRKHHRHSIRLPNYDYSQPGAYFVTIVAWHREYLFGEVVNGEMRLNDVGKIVQWEWLELPKRLCFIELGAFIVMPNHFHGILIFHENAGATRQGLTKARSGEAPGPRVNAEGIDGSPLPRGPQPASLAVIMAQFKSRVTKRLWKIPSLKGTQIWQRNYYEHIIRSERDLQNKTGYVEANPMLWEKDEENPRKKLKS